ncbi:MAG: AAA family ATPase [Nitrospinae bacterium]|nr:AAA family ATPase [Nitrospinota bacterium]
MGGFRCVMAGVCGGSAAGKTTVAQSLASRLARFHPTVVEVDRYYYDRGALTGEQKRAINYDEPAAIEFSLLAASLVQLKQGHAVDVPVYDYATHALLARTDRLKPSRLVIVEGVLLFSDPACRALLDFTIFVQADREERLRRRIARDAVDSIM